jgi:hypothetical protein
MVGFVSISKHKKVEDKDALFILKINKSILNQFQYLQPEKEIKGDEIIEIILTPLQYSEFLSLSPTNCIIARLNNQKI